MIGVRSAGVYFEEILLINGNTNMPTVYSTTSHICRSRWLSSATSADSVANMTGYWSQEINWHTSSVWFIFYLIPTESKG